MSGPDSSDSGPNCPGCRASIEPTWRHCAECGIRLVDDDLPEQTRTVTMVISDLQGSTALAERLDPESLRLVLDQYFDQLGVVFESHGGHIEKRIGDAMVTAFGFPSPAPDDVVRALRATAEGQRTLAELNERLEAGWGVRLVNRTGIATGTVVYASATGAHRVLAGDAFDLAGSLEPLAPALEALAHQSTVTAAGDAATFGPLTTLTTKAGAEVVAAQLLTVTEGETVADAGDPASAGRDEGHSCSGCGAETVAGQAWCVQCGLPLARRARRTESRRTVTVVFADLRALPAEAPDELRRAALLRAFEAARAALEAHGGTVENFIGDAVMAIFGLDRRHEDDALRAVKAAVDMQDRVAQLLPALEAELGVRVEARVGVNTGSVIAGDPDAGERLVTGDAVNVAARLEQTAAPGDVVMGDLTRRLAGPTAQSDALAPLTLKGKSEPVPAFRIRAVLADAERTRGFELPFVGRDAELAAMLDRWERARTTGSWVHAAVVGEAGTGKSRLLHEALDVIGADATVLRGTCLPYGDGITFWPIAEIIRGAAGVKAGGDVGNARDAIRALSPSEDVAVRLLAMIGLDDRIVPVQETFWACRQFFSHLAAERPLILVVDGLQWAEETLRELLADLEGNAPDAPVLLITMERPSADREPAGDDSIEVQPLDEATCATMIDSAIGAGVFPADVQAHVVRASGGVPLFVEQLFTMLIGDGRLRLEDGRWTVTADVEHLTVPPSIEALVAARVDALTDDERTVVEPASVMGRTFPQQAVERIIDRADLDGALDSLHRRQMVSPLGDDDPLADHRFRNLMIRDVVYDGLLKRTRSVLHRRFAAWMEDGPASGRLSELQEIIGYHYEQAYLLGREVAAVDPDLAAVGEIASGHLSAAGERAVARGDLPAAGNLLQRAARVLHQQPVRTAQLLVAAADAIWETGAFARAGELFVEAGDLATGAGDEVTAAAARLAHTTMRYLIGDGMDDTAALATVDELLPVFEHAGDHSRTAKCHRLHAYIDGVACRWGAAEASALLVADHARLAGDTVLERRVLPGMAGFSLYGPTPITDALARCEQWMDDLADDPHGRALIQQFAAHLAALDGHFDEAREGCRAARATLVELGWNFEAALVSAQLGQIEMAAGDPAAAEAALAPDVATLRAMGEQNYLSTSAAHLAEALARQGRLDEAETTIEEVLATVTDDDLYTHLLWRSTRVRLLIERGHTGDALDLARETAEMALTTDSPLMRGNAFLVLASAQRAAADEDAAREAAQEALTEYAVKEDRVGAARVRAFLAGR